MKRRVILIFLCIVLSTSLVGVNEASAIEYLDGDLIIHGKITQTLAFGSQSQRLSYLTMDNEISVQVLNGGSLINPHERGR